MGDVVDVRPDRFLREIRDHGDIGKACQNSGLTEPEVNELCRANIQFDRSFIECHLEFMEEKSLAELRRALGLVRKLAHLNLEARHGG